MVSQGGTIEEARANLVETIELLFEDPTDRREIDPAPAIVPIDVQIPHDLQATA